MEMEYDDDSVILVTGEEHRSKGNKFYGQGNYKAALECYTAAIDTEPDVASFYNNRSAVLIMLSRYQEAFNDSKKSCELDPSNTKALIRLGKCHMLLGCWNEAESVLQRVLEIEPSNNEARANLEKLAQCKSSFEQYRAQKDKQDFRHALFCIERCLEISPGSTELEIARIELWIYLKRYTEVKNSLEVIIKDQSNQTNIEAIYCRGLYFYYLDHIDKALTHFQHVLKSCPDHTGSQQAYRRAKRLTALKEQGNALVKTCNYEQAREVYTSALELDPLHDDINAKLHCNRALTLIKIERYEEALSDCDRAVKLDPQYLKARSRRVTCFIGLERFDEAIREAEQLQKSHPAEEHSRLVKEARLALKRSKQFNPYSVLGVTKGATDSEIKKAYRKRALQHHPDRHSHADEAMRRAEEVKFKEVNNAYSVLSDARKRQMYDSGVDIDEVLGNCGGGGASSSFHGDPMEVFQAFFNSSGGNTGFRFSTSFNH